MAYNPQFYSPYFPQNYPQVQPQQVQQPQAQQIQPVQQTQPQQMQNGGFMVVPSEDIARTYPVAPGNCVTFKIEGKPIVMEKSMGFSQLEAPRIDRYRLVREEDVPPAQEEPKEADYSQYIQELKESFSKDMDEIWSEINGIKSQISKPSTTKKKDTGGN